MCGLTFHMSGGSKGTKRLLERPLKGLVGPELTEERMIDFIRRYGIETEFQALKHIDESLTVDKLYGRHAVARCFPARFSREGAGRDNNSLVCSPSHSTTKVSNVRRRYRLRISLALEEHLHGHEWIDLKSAVTVDSTVSALACHIHLSKPRLSQ